MNLLVILMVALAGALGAVCRFTVDTLVRQSFTSYQQRHASSATVITPAWGTLVVNLTGCFLVGLVGAKLSGYTVASNPALAWLYTALASGFLGGYTTFSTAMMDVINLLLAPENKGKHAGQGLALALGTLVGGIIMAYLGWLL